MVKSLREMRANLNNEISWFRGINRDLERKIERDTQVLNDQANHIWELERRRALLDFYPNLINQLLNSEKEEE